MSTKFNPVEVLENIIKQGDKITETSENINKRLAKNEREQIEIFAKIRDASGTIGREIQTAVKSVVDNVNITIDTEKAEQTAEKIKTNLTDQCALLEAQINRLNHGLKPFNRLFKFKNACLYFCAFFLVLSLALGYGLYDFYNQALKTKSQMLDEYRAGLKNRNIVEYDELELLKLQSDRNLLLDVIRDNPKSKAKTARNKAHTEIEQKYKSLK